MVIVGESGVERGEGGQGNGWKGTMQVGRQFGPQFLGEFSIQWALPGETLHQFAGDVFAIRATAPVAAKQQLVAVRETIQQDLMGSADVRNTVLKFRVATYHGFD